MKLGKLTEYDMINIFLEKSHAKCCREAIPRFYKNEQQIDLLINSLKWYKICFRCMSSQGLPKHIKTKMVNTYFCLIQSVFKKENEVRN